MDELDGVLARAQATGLLGPAPIEDHRHHALGFLDRWPGGVGLVAELGAGGGVPGLVLAWVRPELELILIDARSRCADLLDVSVRELGLDGRVTVVHERAEVVGRSAAWRSSVDVVVARGFGPPPVVAECAAPLLNQGGVVVVSEPPRPDVGRWPEQGLATLGLRRGEDWSTAAGHYQRLDQVWACPTRYPRRVGIPAKRPLWSV